MIEQDLSSIADQLVPVMQQLNSMALELRNQNLQVRTKRDGSVVTNADTEIEQVLTRVLSDLTPAIPVIGEEALAAGEAPETAASYWLIDPIDGTSGYVANTIEFAISVGLIDQGRPVLGLIGLPSEHMVYVGLVQDQRAYSVNKHNVATPLRAKQLNTQTPRVVHSRHEMPSRLFKMFGQSAQLTPMGSARKFVMMANGSADYYVRTFGLSEYDIAGGHALAQAAGCTVFQTNGQPIEYGHSLYVGSFLISAPS